MKDIIEFGLDQVTPPTKKRSRSKPCPWMTAELKQKMAERNKLIRKSCKTRLPAH